MKLRMKVRVKILLIAVVLGICYSGFAKADLSKRINHIISSQKNVNYSVHIIKADTGRAVYGHNSRELMIPASNMKIITTAAALKYLGPDYEFKTKVGLCGDMLVIIGGGDPLLGDEKTDAKYGRERDWIFDDIAVLLKRKGIRAVRNIVVDSSIFDDERVHPHWPAKDLNKWFACEVSGLNYNDNCIDMTVTNVRGKINVSFVPRTTFIKLVNQVKPISQGKNVVGTYRNKKPNNLTVHGTCKDKVGPFYVAIERPAVFFGALVAENLSKSGIKARGELIEKASGDYEDFKLLKEYKTPIADCLARCNKNSLGLVAEVLMKTIAANSEPDGKGGSWERGQELVGDYLSGIGIDKSQFFIDDGSGLSRQNELSAWAITRVLLSVYKSENWEMYKKSLAVGGVDGTIDDRFEEPKYKGRIFGKTGYISGVKSLSGVCSTAKGDYIFSILANNTNGLTTTAINKIAKAIFD